MSDFGGALIVVNGTRVVFACWCGRCWRELSDLAAKLESDGDELLETDVLGWALGYCPASRRRKPLELVR